MLKTFRIPRRATQLSREAAAAKRATQMYYLLLDSGRFASPAEFAGQDAAQSVAETFGVPTGLVWQWIRDGQYSKA